ncbi:LAME_0G05402g1_1 [Lachancea meyersii CBS 8951]|uniref:LAME_0G05402g1_1 n=1 Tax=Lachancea meyersii CBS 8951 TaxID=1266667 RepID=A0A1G4K766_9SACH|nr:LAME_0G05402g1_1 [Lachancea meyersii CBS 8951]
MGTKGVEMAIWNDITRLEKKRERLEIPSPTKFEAFDYEKQDIRKARRFQGTRRRNAGILIILLLFNLCLHFASHEKVQKLYNGRMLSFSRTSSSPVPVQESFEITVEQLPEKPPVFSQELVQHSFGDSWGKPFTASFQPYTGGEYDSLILELATNVSGRQYDRLVHVFIEDVNVWRSSTVEPWGNKTVVSHSIKDISSYRSLFKDQPLNVTLQLDNLVTNKLTGIFNVTLKLYYYKKEDAIKEDESSLRGKLLQIFTKPADVVTPLVTRFSRTPLFYYPLASKENPRWTRGLPEIDLNPNVSRVVVEIFASGNAAEEFWYTNVLDNYTGKFRDHGKELLGHGPFRAINFYLTDSETEILVDTVIPTPVIFTGFFPPLWRPCVGMNAFNIKSFKVDLTPFLSLFENGTWQMQLEVVSSTTPSFKVTVGENWIFSGNVHVWTNKDLISGSKFINSTVLEPTFEVDVDDSHSDELKQKVLAKNGVQIDSRFTIDQTNYEVRSVTESLLKSQQVYLETGDEEFAFVDLLTKRSSTISKNGVDLYRFSDETGWLFDAEMEIVSQERSSLTYSASVSRELNRTVGLHEINESGDSVDVLFALDGIQSGNASYTLSPEGNHGSGDSFHSVALEHGWPFQNNFRRTVVVKDNVVVVDTKN